MVNLELSQLRRPAAENSLIEAEKLVNLLSEDEMTNIKGGEINLEETGRLLTSIFGQAGGDLITSGLNSLFGIDE